MIFLLNILHSTGRLLPQSECINFVLCLTCMVHFVTRGVQVKLWDPLRTCAIPECLRGVITTKHYTNPHLPLLSFTFTCLALVDLVPCWLLVVSGLVIFELLNKGVHAIKRHRLILLCWNHWEIRVDMYSRILSHLSRWHFVQFYLNALCCMFVCMFCSVFFVICVGCSFVW